MTTEAISRYRAALNKRMLTDAARANLLGAIQQMAPRSPLSNDPAIAASLAAIGAKGARLATSVAGVSNAQKQLKAVTTQRALARNAFDLELEALKTLVENAATSAGDITAMGLTLLTVNKATHSMPDPPAELLVRIGRAHGKARVSVRGPDNAGSFVAEASPDPVGPTTWTTLPGTGRQRKLAGYASGTRLWVRFARVRYGMQSDWSTPVLVIIP